MLNKIHSSASHYNSFQSQFNLVAAFESSPAFKHPFYNMEPKTKSVFKMWFLEEIYTTLALQFFYFSIHTPINLICLLTVYKYFKSELQYNVRVPVLTIQWFPVGHFLYYFSDDM